MFKNIFFVFFAVCSLAFCSTTFAVTEDFQAGKHYKVLSTSMTSTATKSGKIEVLEFFSYGCPWCYRLEPTLEKWLSSHPKHVAFERVPVTFEPGWEVLTKAYYIATAFGIQQKITPAMFAAIHNDGKDLSTQTELENLFTAHGLSKKNFESAYNVSPEITTAVNRGNELMRQYQISEIPTFIIGGKYETSVAMVKGDNEKLMRLINFLVKKEVGKS